MLLASQIHTALPCKILRSDLILALVVSSVLASVSHVDCNVERGSWDHFVCLLSLVLT